MTDTYVLELLILGQYCHDPRALTGVPRPDSYILAYGSP